MNWIHALTAVGYSGALVTFFGGVFAFEVGHPKRAVGLTILCVLLFSMAVGLSDGPPR